MNDHWLEYTRSILEAFWHTKYYTQMMIKYAKELETAPQMMPSASRGSLVALNCVSRWRKHRLVCGAVAEEPAPALHVRFGFAELSLLRGFKVPGPSGHTPVNPLPPICPSVSEHRSPGRV